MKTLTLSLIGLCAMLLALPAKAEIGLGVRAGLNTSSLKIKGEGSLGNKVSDFEGGFFIGPTVDWKASTFGLGADASVLFSKRGADEFEQKGIEIPINLRLYVFDVDGVLGLYAAAGPNFFFNFKNDYQMFKKKNSEVGLDLGIGAKLLNHVDLGINYLIPLGDSFEPKSIVGKVMDSDMRMRTWQFSVAVTI